MVVSAKPRVRVKAGSSQLHSMIAPTTTISKPKVAAQYMKGEASPFFHNWNPVLRSANDDVRSAYITAVSRAIDTIHNSGWISGAIDQAIGSTVGQGLRLAVKPDAEALGWTQDRAQEWSRLVERRWEGWSMRPIECDILGSSTIGKLTASAMRTYFGYGEITAALPYRKRVGGQYGTKVQLIEPHRLTQRSDNINLFQGVRCDDTGFPLGYTILEDKGLLRGTEREIPARDPYGRPQFIHVFDGAIGQRRGLPLITPALKVVKQFDQLADATLTAALIQAIFAATIKSADPTEVTLQAFQDMAEQATEKPSAAPISGLEAMIQSRTGWYDATNIDLGRYGKIAHLAPGDQLDFHSSTRPNDTYEAFVRFLLREIARCLGITFEQLTGDYTGATYSSVRMATSEIWQIVLYRRVNIIAPTLDLIYEAWLEEEIENGWVPFPGGIDGFQTQRAAATRCHWRGPAKPQADDAKFAQAVATLMALGVVTAEWVCAELGDDWQDTFEQIAHEQAMREKFGIPAPVFKPGATAEAANAPAEIAAQPAPAPAKGK